MLLLDKSPLPHILLKNNTKTHDYAGRYRRIGYIFKIYITFDAVLFFISFKFNSKFVLSYFKLYNIPIKVAGESCKKTIVDANRMETNGMILYAILSKFMASSEARGHEFDDKIV